VVAAPESVTTRALTIQVSNRPAGEVLDLVLEAGSLRGLVRGGSPAGPVGRAGGVQRLLAGAKA
jgi:hypothetical protein